MNPVLHGLAANPSLPPEAVDRLIALADDDLADILACRPDLGRDQAVALVARAEDSAVRLAYEGRLTAADIDPVVHPQVALALLDRRAGRPEWARLFAADPDGERRAKLAACPGLPPDVVERLAADPDVHVVAELAWWATLDVAARLAGHPYAEVRRAVAANEATPAGTLAALITGAGLPPALHCLVCDREEIPFTHDPHCPRPDCDLLPGAPCDGSHESVTHDTGLAALQNPATPTGAAVHFAEHPSLLLRRALAARPDLPPAVCRRLAADPVPGVRADLAANPAIDDDLIRVLARDRDPDVRRGLAYHPRPPGCARAPGRHDEDRRNPAAADRLRLRHRDRGTGPVAPPGRTDARGPSARPSGRCTRRVGGRPRCESGQVHRPAPGPLRSSVALHGRPARHPGPRPGRRQPARAAGAAGGTGPARSADAEGAPGDRPAPPRDGSGVARLLGERTSEARRCSAPRPPATGHRGPARRLRPPGGGSGSRQPVVAAAGDARAGAAEVRARLRTGSAVGSPPEGASPTSAMRWIGRRASG
ncbi:protein of unknown function [Streptomyces sp. KY75]|nr:protein of unknown function [Streptomyces sp. KY70]CAD5988926.1 protein of unknown function [Streptomyces sp. KY75]